MNELLLTSQFSTHDWRMAAALLPNRIPVREIEGGKGGGGGGGCTWEQGGRGGGQGKRNGTSCDIVNGMCTIQLMYTIYMIWDSEDKLSNTTQHNINPKAFK